MKVLFGTGAAAIVIAGGAFAAFAEPGGTSTTASTSTTTTTVSSTSNTTPTTTSCKKPYPPAAPTLTIDASPTTVVAGASTTLSGLLSVNSCVLPKEPIDLHRVLKSADTVLATVTTAKDGTYAFTFAPAATATYYAVFAGDGGFLPSQSGTVAVTVKKK